ncbi:hypothetical protein K438DRAFT_1765340 [Mycena galopus ATCC 62051]|nr:hypothetical protein K438DRAFT_1765340 [Mycena galopus ATCC 62051]
MSSPKFSCSAPRDQKKEGGQNVENKYRTGFMRGLNLRIGRTYISGTCAVVREDAARPVLKNDVIPSSCLESRSPASEVGSEKLGMSKNRRRRSLSYRNRKDCLCRSEYGTFVRRISARRTVFRSRMVRRRTRQLGFQELVAEMYAGRLIHNATQPALRISADSGLEAKPEGWDASHGTRERRQIEVFADNPYAYIFVADRLLGGLRMRAGVEDVLLWYHPDNQDQDQDTGSVTRQLLPRRYPTSIDNNR